MQNEEYINEIINGDIHTANQKLQDLNQEIRQRHSSMHLYTEQEMQNLGVWLEETERVVKDLENNSLIIIPSFKTLREKVQRAQGSIG